MTSDSDINRAAAERVMGWMLKSTYNEHISNGRTYKVWRNAAEFDQCMEMKWDPEHKIDQAFQCMDTAAATRSHMTPGEPMWTLYRYESDSDGPRLYVVRSGLWCEGEADTPARAATLCALAVVGWTADE